MMNRTNFLTASVAALFSLQAMGQTVDEIVNKHVAALGGMDKLNSVKTLVMQRSFSIQGMDIPSKTTYILGRGMRSESVVMGNSMIQVIDGTSGWMIRPAMMGGTGDPEDMPAELLKQQLGQADPFPLANYKEKGTTVELVGKEKVDKKDAYHLKVTPKGGQPMDEYLDADTYLLSKVQQTVNGQPGAATFSNYKATDGIQFPGTTEVEAGQMGTLTFTTEKVTVNPSVSEAMLKKGSK